MTDKKKEADLEAAKNITLDEMADAAADICEAEHAEDMNKIDLRDVRMFLAGDPLPIDPETGEIAVDKLTDAQREEMKAAIKAMAETFAEISPGMKALKDSYSKLREQIIKGSGIERLQELFTALKKSISTDAMRDVLRGLNDDLRAVQDLISEIDELKPFIEAELKKGEYGGLSFDNIMQDYTPRELLEMQSDPDSTIHKLFEAARKAKSEALPIVAISRADRLKTPTDRFNFLAFNDFKETDGQIAFNMMSERDKRDPERSKLNISMRYSLTFGDEPGMKTTRELNHFDRRLQQAIDSLYVPGEQNIFLIGDISEAMGGSRNPSESRRKKINDSLTKQGTARIFINNAKEVAEYDYPFIEYDGIVLDFERIRIIYNGQETIGYKIISRPKMMEIADQRNQMSVVPIEVIQSGINQTNKTLQIEDYLLYRIIRQKNTIIKLQEPQQKNYTQNRQKQIREKSKLVILLDTFYEQTGTAGKKSKDKKRAVEHAEKYLKHYKKTGYIVDYNIDEKRIEIELPIR